MCAVRAEFTALLALLGRVVFFLPLDPALALPAAFVLPVLVVAELLLCRLGLPAEGSAARGATANEMASRPARHCDARLETGW